MAIKKEQFGALSDGQKVTKYVLSRDDFNVSVLDYGATIQSITLGGREMVLGYDSAAGYEQGGSYQGATVGRYANRISGPGFQLGDQYYKLEKNNDGKEHLHGGFGGFAHRMWSVKEIFDDESEPGICFEIFSADMDDGYPGNFTASVTFTITDYGTLNLRYSAKSDRDTVINLTNHAYFSLGQQSILDTEIMINADRITEVDKDLIPTGELIPVEGTPFDFTTPHKIGERIREDNAQLKYGGGYDHNFVLGTERLWRLAAVARTPDGVGLRCYTDMVGVQFYTANMLNEKTGRGGAPLGKNAGFCLETQFFPDTPNNPAFPSCVLKADHPFNSSTSYRFTLDK